MTSSTCPSCHGSGVSITKKPRDADHMGMVRKDELVEIDIPSGVEDGVQLVCEATVTEPQLVAFLVTS